jgi:hypothetical protein
MKTTKILKALYVLIFAALISTNFGCAALFNAELDGDIPMKDGFPDFEKLEQKTMEDFRKRNNIGIFPEIVHYPQSFLDVAGGLGFDSTEDDSEFSYCLGAGYNYRISQDNFNNASYIRAFGTYTSTSADERKFNVTRVGAGYTLFDRASSNGKLDLTYGVDFNYGFGKFENFGFEEDYSEIAAALKVGVNYELSPKVHVGFTLPVASWAQQTYESQGFEFEQQHTWVGVNKDNLVMGYARINLD